MTTDTLSHLVDYFTSERGDHLTPTATDNERDRLAELLTTRPPALIPDDIARLLDNLLAAEANDRPTTAVSALPRIRDQVPDVAYPLAGTSVWQGDITTLAIDAIVNAANDRMLGCFIPNHRCIDNAIHAAAGPALRAECAQLMTTQGHPEPTGHAKVTAGYHLPAHYVIHTVGPIVPNRKPTIEHADLLASSYRACLDAALRVRASSIAFCSISTGVFGYPIELATPVALKTVAAWLTDHPATGMHVVFNTFSHHDTDTYLTTLAAQHR